MKNINQQGKPYVYASERNLERYLKQLQYELKHEFECIEMTFYRARYGKDKDFIRDFIKNKIGHAIRSPKEYNKDPWRMKQKWPDFE